MSTGKIYNMKYAEPTGNRSSRPWAIRKHKRYRKRRKVTPERRALVRAFRNGRSWGKIHGAFILLGINIGIQLALILLEAAWKWCVVLWHYFA